MRFELTNYIRFDSNGTKGVVIMALIHDQTTPLLVETKGFWFGGGELVLKALVSNNQLALCLLEGMAASL
jgi:hypothetical protein